MPINHLDCLIATALKEDHAYHDLTTSMLISSSQRSEAYIVCKERAVICGLNLAKNIFRKLDKSMKISSPLRDGCWVSKNSRVLHLKGKTRALLSAERVALNFLSHLSGIATQTAGLVKKTEPYAVEVFDTRKTTPGLRLLEKMAVKCAGGKNHRLHLEDAVMIKDNHLAAGCSFDDLGKKLFSIRRKTKKSIILEVDNLKQLQTALTWDVDIILLDNMTLKAIKQAVAMRKAVAPAKKIQLEVSGNVTQKNIAAIAKTGIERISTGAITHSVKAVDLSLEFIK